MLNAPRVEPLAGAGPFFTDDTFRFNEEQNLDSADFEVASSIHLILHSYVCFGTSRSLLTSFPFGSAVHYSKEHVRDCVHGHAHLEVAVRP